MAESDHIVRTKMRFSSYLARDSTFQDLIASKLQNQSNSSCQIAPTSSHSENRFIKDRCHHHSSLLSWKIDTKLPRARPRVMMKNLHLRRVFSPSSVSSDWDIHMKGENRTKELDNSTCDPPNFNVTRGEGSKDIVGSLVAPGDDFEAVDSSQMVSEIFRAEPSLTRIEAGFFICQEINGVSGEKVGTNVGSKRIRHPEKIFKNSGLVSYRRLLSYLKGTADGTKDFHAINPKNESGELMAVKSRVHETEPVWKFANSYAEHHGGNISLSKKMTSSNTSLCSRRKLYKVPGSVNYRRMLSYLKEKSETPVALLDTRETSQHTDPAGKNVEENAPATENKEASNEAMDSNVCSNHVVTPL